MDVQSYKMKSVDRCQGQQIPVRLQPITPQSRVMHSTTEPPRSSAGTWDSVHSYAYANDSKVTPHPFQWVDT